MEEKNLPPNLDVVLSDLKREIFATLNCVQVGRITKVTGAEQSVEVQLQIRQPLIDGTSAIIPVLVDVPFFVLQGGSAFINMPVSIGDYCIVLFNDRDIDTWWTTDGVSDPNTTRKHNLSDGIALVGINPKTAVRSYNGTNLELVGGENPINLKNDLENMRALLHDTYAAVKAIVTFGNSVTQSLSQGSKDSFDALDTRAGNLFTGGS